MAPRPTASGPLGLAALGVLLLAAPAASAHANHVEVDPQVAAEPRAVVEGLFSTSHGWVVLHEVNATGQPAEPIGKAELRPDAGFRTDVPVPVDEEVWANWSGAPQLAAALHEDDGDRRFEPDQDGIVESIAGPVVDDFHLARDPAPASVRAVTFGPQPLENGTVNIRAAALPDAGHVRLEAPSEVTVGDQQLAAGEHANVTVAVDRSALGVANGTVHLTATLYADDGDGEPDGDDEPVRAGNATVSTELLVEVSPPEETSQTNETNATGSSEGSRRTGLPAVGPLAGLVLAGLAGWGGRGTANADPPRG